MLTGFEYRFRNKYIKSIDQDTKKRQELNVLHVREIPHTSYKSSITGKEMIWCLDSKKCTGCKQCVMACSLAKAKKYNPIESRIYVKKTESKGWSVPMVCEHCVQAPCANACPVYAIKRDKETGIVNIDLNTCMGCRLCRYACPWGKETIDIREVKGYKGPKAIKCDLCEGDPACAKVCIPGVIHWVKLDKDSPNLKWTLAKTRADDVTNMDIEWCH